MPVLVAENLGFCNGVELAMNKAESTLQTLEKGTLYLYGEIVHNSYVTGLFTSRGAVVVSGAGEMKAGDTAVIRAHGITDSERSLLEGKGVRVVDATCPVVLRNQGLVRTSPLPVIVFGDPKHAEVLSLVGAAKGEVHVVFSPEDFLPLEKKSYRCLVQTTLSQKLLDDLMEEGRSLGMELDLVSSVCNASVKRRKGVLDLKGQVDAFVVVGDRKSTNTRELVETASSMGVPAFLVDGIQELPQEILKYDRIGMTAGASTPKELYEKVRTKLENKER